MALPLLLVAASLCSTPQLELPAVRNDAPFPWLSRRVSQWYRVLRPSPPEIVQRHLGQRMELERAKLKRRVQKDLLHQVTGWERVRCALQVCAARPSRPRHGSQRRLCRLLVLRTPENSPTPSTGVPSESCPPPESARSPSSAEALSGSRLMRSCCRCAAARRGLARGNPCAQKLPLAVRAEAHVDVAAAGLPRGCLAPAPPPSPWPISP
jgi:hypothetical protein